MFTIDLSLDSDDDGDAVTAPGSGQVRRSSSDAVDPRPAAAQNDVSAPAKRKSENALAETSNGRISKSSPDVQLGGSSPNSKKPRTDTARLPTYGSSSLPKNLFGSGDDSSPTGLEINIYQYFLAKLEQYAKEAAIPLARLQAGICVLAELRAIKYVDLTPGNEHLVLDRAKVHEAGVQCVMCLYGKSFFDQGVQFAVLKPSGDDLRFPSDDRLHPYMGVTDDLVRRNAYPPHGKLKMYGEMAECRCLGHGIASPALSNPAEEALIFIVKLMGGSHAGNSSPYSKIPFFPRPAKNAELDILRTMRAKLFVSAYNSPPFLALNSGADCSAVRNPGQPHESYLSRSFATNNELMGHQPPLALDEYPKIPCPQLPTAHISIADQKAAKRDFFAKLEPYPDVLGLLFYGDRPTEIFSIVSAPGWGNESWMGKPRFATVTLDELQNRSFFAAAFLDTAIVGYAQGAARVLALDYFFELDRCTIELTDYILRMRKLLGIEEVLKKARTMWDESLGPRMLERAEELRPWWNVPKGGGAELHQGLSADESVAPHGLPDYKVNLSSLRPEFESTFADWKQYHRCDAITAEAESASRTAESEEDDLGDASPAQIEAAIEAAEILTQLRFGDKEAVKKMTFVGEKKAEAKEVREAVEKAADRAERASRTRLRYMAFEAFPDYDALPEAAQEARLREMKAALSATLARRIKIGAATSAYRLGLMSGPEPDFTALDEAEAQRIVSTAVMKLDRHNQLRPYSPTAELVQCLTCNKDFCRTMRKDKPGSLENGHSPHPQGGGSNCAIKKFTKGWTCLPSIPGVRFDFVPVTDLLAAALDDEAEANHDGILVINFAQVASTFGSLLRELQAAGHLQALYLVDIYEPVIDFFIKIKCLADEIGDTDEVVEVKHALKSGFGKGMVEGLARAGRFVAKRKPRRFEADKDFLTIFAFGSIARNLGEETYLELENLDYLGYQTIVDARTVADGTISMQRSRKRQAEGKAKKAAGKKDPSQLSVSDFFQKKP
ncbi:hypothetical protein DFJ74DRAFT_752844 [Hyaloraphidium curvatum]|nr:hypothetical protein DFJ74DRAFT_704353 [Hyaloraphidium curvatum]KAI9026926.1 hypothetical protein DFJ74DRAFT_752844 [Hyaloraphidium curvatum]